MKFYTFIFEKEKTTNLLDALLCALEVATVAIYQLELHFTFINTM